MSVHKKNFYDVLSKNSSEQNNMFSIISIYKTVCVCVCVCACAQRETRKINIQNNGCHWLENYGKFSFFSFVFSVCPMFSTINIPYLYNQKKIKCYNMQKLQNQISNVVISLQLLTPESTWR